MISIKKCHKYVTIKLLNFHTFSFYDLNVIKRRLWEEENWRQMPKGVNGCLQIAIEVFDDLMSFKNFPHNLNTFSIRRYAC